jgi:inner membrane protein
LILGANLPDADLVLGFLSPEAYLLWHRGLTHALAGLLIFPPAFAALAHGLFPALTFGRALLLLELAFLSHILLDLPTAWGTLLLYPWSHVRFALDWIFIIDPFLWAGLALGILGGMKRAPGVRRRMALGGLGVAVLYVAAAGILHTLALEKTRAAARAGAGVESGLRGTGDVEVYPVPFSPLRWHGVAWRGRSLEHYFLAGLPPRVAGKDSEPHGLSDPRARPAIMSPAGQMFLYWARAPAARIVSTSDTTVVGLIDRRFYGRNVFGLKVAVGPGGKYLHAVWD